MLKIFSLTIKKIIFFACIVFIIGSSIVVVKNLQQKAKAVSSAVFSPKVLAIGFNPSDGKRDIASTYFGMEGKTPAQFEDYVFNDTITAFKEFSQDTINYQIVKKMNISTFPTYTNGFKFTIDNYKQCVWGGQEYNASFCEQQKSTFDYIAWIRDNKICEIADSLKVDEIWVMSPPYIMQWESFMFGPTDSFSVNANAYITTQCNKHYVVMDSSYERSGPFLHIYGHRIESFMTYMTSYWNKEDIQKYWDQFSSVSRYADPNSSYSGTACGNAHFPVNAETQYDYGNRTVKSFNCNDWNNFPNFTGTSEKINCTAWGCTDTGWQKYWFASIPHSSGSVGLLSKSGKSFFVLKNWWYYFLYPENTIQFEKTTLNCQKNLGDANCNGVINLEDFEIFRREYTKFESSIKSDFNSDGTITLIDFEIWRNSFHL